MNQRTHISVLFLIIAGCFSMCGLAVFATMLIDEEQLSNGALILTLALLAISAALVIFTHKNRRNIEDFVLQRDEGALRKIICGARKSQRAQTQATENEK